jgi:hypothetical protein
MSRLLVLVLLPSLLLFAAKKTVSTANGENDELALTVTLHIDPEDIKGMLGSDLEGHYIVAEVRAEPKYGKTVNIDRDDFLIRSRADNDRSKPFTASQIAGNTTMVITHGEAPKVKNKPSIGFGGMGMGGGTASSSGNQDEYKNAKTAVKTSDTENPLEKTLDQKILPEKKTDQAVSGLLYFPIEKQKIKDLQLEYGGKENRITLQFK